MSRAPTQTPAAGKGYKRSWKNLLINKRYQLQFTLFMVGLSTVLMAGLGIWVMRVANETTTVSMSSVRGTPCPKIPELIVGGSGGDAAGLVDYGDVDPDPTPMQLDEPGQPAPPPPAPVDTGEDDLDAAVDGETGEGETDDGEPRRPRVMLDESSMTMLAPPVVPPHVSPEFGPKVVAHWTCELQVAGRIAALERGRLLILWVLIGTGLLLVLGLAIYGIKMTHRVAGPLFKVSLYLAKMKDGRFDKVWNLRKGDQLVEFYEHFKTAHAGVVEMQKDDIAKIKAVIVNAEAAGLGEHASVVALRELLTRKEKSIE